MSTNKKQIKDFNLLTGIVGSQDNILLQRESGTTFRTHVNNLLTWNNITNTPTTLEGYGITDGGSSSNTSGVSFVHLTRAELLALQSTNGLVAGGYYMITDFKTVYDQPNYDYNGDAILTNNYKECEVEPIVVLATSNNTISINAYQPKYPKDIIKYDINWSITEVSGSAAYGRIIERIDEYNNRTNYDHRNIVFKRYRSYYLSGDINGFSSINNFTVTGTNTSFTNLSTSGYVLVGEKLFKISNIIDDVNMTIEGHNGVYYDNIKIYSAYPYDENDYFNCLEWKQNNIIDDNYFKEYKTFQNDYEIQEDYGLSRYNYIGDSNNYDFYLPNNVFGMESYNNIIGNNTINNHFQRARNNSIGNYMERNIFYDSFTENKILNYFEDNICYSDFEDNKVGNNFDGNLILQYFENNNISDYFEDNKLYNDFEDNQIGNSFYYNIIYNDFESNVIKDDFIENEIYEDFENNQIGYWFYNNTIYQYFHNNVIGDIFENNSSSSGEYEFEDNIIGNNFKGNLILEDFIGNTIGSEFTANIMYDDFRGNKIGNTAIINNFHYTLNNIMGNDVSNNTFGNNFESNILGNNISNNRIGTNCTNNRIGDMFQNNDIINYFLYNTIGIGFQGNDIGYYFTNNTVGNNFESNNVIDNVSSNSFGNNIASNTFGDTFSYNTLSHNIVGSTFGNGCNSNIINCALLNSTFGSAFINNTIFAANSTTDYTSYTHLYNSYTCTVKKGSDNLIYLEYFNGTANVYVEIVVV